MARNVAFILMGTQKAGFFRLNMKKLKKSVDFFAGLTGRKKLAGARYLIDF